MRPLYKEVYSLDKRCYELGMSEDILMENAALNLYKEIKERNLKSVLIIAGPGNNGGDGIALARMLLGEIDVHLFLPLGVKSKMAKLQLQRYENFGGKYSQFEMDKSKIKKYECYVDAIFGSGLKRDIDNKINSIIKILNKKDGFKLACDIPTGLDNNGNKKGIVFKADVTITMGAAKLSLYSDNAKDYVGDIKVANLGVSFKNYINKSNFFVLEKKDMILPIRNKKTSHKGSYGHLGVLVGEKEGAGIVSALAGINFGAGLVTAVTKEKINIPYEIMHSSSIGDYSAIAFGMGMGNFYDDELKKICKLNIPKVLDADMFYKKEILFCLENNNKLVLTPHPKEFSSLLKICEIGEYDVNSIQNNRFELAMRFSKKYPNIVLLLKGSNTIIVYKNQLYINPYGTQALAKGGSGDVLAGMIGALLSQGYHPLKATITATLAHSFAGNIHPNYSLTPLKLIDNLEKIKTNNID
jgi:hydroxyethylthiazole kinase-like uncharacterized protein yjeF